MNQFTSFNNIIGNGKRYQVPLYQRDYSWRKNEELEDLWQDILNIEQDDEEHYMGYLVLLAAKDKSELYEVIDGQQRLTTLSLLALAVIKLMEDWANAGIDTQINIERKNEELRRYIGVIDTSIEASINATIEPLFPIAKKPFLPLIPKLTLNRSNNDYYQSYLRNFRRASNINREKPSVRLLQQAFDYFYDKLVDKFGAEKSGASLAKFLEKTAGNRLVFSVIEVENESAAYKVFETLNARGVKLSSADLLKNYLFSQANKLGNATLEEADRRWQKIVDILGKMDVKTFIRHYWNSKRKSTRDSALFKSIKTEIVGGTASLELLDNLESQAEFYVLFEEPYNEFWNKEESNGLELIKLLDISTCYPLMLAYLARMPRAEFHKLLKEIGIIALRYIISELNPNDAEVAYSSTANKIYAGELTDVRSIVQNLKSIYVQDQAFESNFTLASIKTSRKRTLVKYLLVKIENQIANTQLDYTDSKISIEHILPENPGDIWEADFPLGSQEDYISRLGNYTLLPRDVNNKLDNEMSFAEKLEVYKTTSFVISKKYCDYDSFNFRNLQMRQNDMAKIAKTVWKSAYIQ